MKKISTIFLFLFASFFFLSFANFAQAANPINWSTNRLTFQADDFSITTNEKTFVGGNVQFYAETETPTNTTFTATWKEHDVDMQLFMRFSIKDGKWKTNEIKTFNGKTTKDWLSYPVTEFPETNGQSAYTAKSLDLKSSDKEQTGTIHFTNLTLHPSFTVLHIVSPAGGEVLTAGSTVPIQWFFDDYADLVKKDKFTTNISLQKSDETSTTPIANNFKTGFFDNQFPSWNIANTIPSGQYKIHLQVIDEKHVSSVSSKPFTINNPAIPIVEPSVTSSPTPQPKADRPLDETTTPTPTPTITSEPTKTETLSLTTKTPEKSINENKEETVAEKTITKPQSFLDKIVGWFKNILPFI